MAVQQYAHLARVRRALAKGAPATQLDDRVIEYFAGMLAEYWSEEGELLDQAELAEAWLPFFDSAASHAGEDASGGLDVAAGAAHRACQAVLRRLASTGSSATPEAESEAASADVGDSGADGADAADGPSPPEAVHGLVDWLESLNLSYYLEHARDWCEGMGAADVEEVIENWEEFCSELRLRPLERRRVEKACKRLAAAPLQADAVSVTAAAAGASYRGDALDNARCDNAVASSPSTPPRAKAAPSPDVALVAAVARAARPSRSPIKARGRPASPPQAAQPGANTEALGAWKSGSLLPLLRKEASRQPETFGPLEDPYEIVGELGSGATASVHRCRRRGQYFAVKSIRLSRLRMQRDCARFLERVHRESAILFAMRHPHVVSLYEVHETREKLYLVMELVDGGELYTDTVRGGALPEHVARYVFTQIVSGLRYIHSAGVVHRDLKPENVLVDRPASRPGLLEVKISDFGHSKLVDDGYSTALSCVGTPVYWAPEVADAGACVGSRSYDERSDLWSLGVLLHVMLIGTYPWSGTEPNASEEAVRQLQERLSSASTGISAAAADIICRLIRVSPDDRLPLRGCLRHAWVTLADGPLLRILDTCEHFEGAERRRLVRSVPLPKAPADARSLRRELQALTNRFHFPATLVRREIVVFVAAAEDENGNASSELVDSCAWEALMAILERHFPADGLCGEFCRPDVRTLSEPSERPVREASPTTATVECKALPPVAEDEDADASAAAARADEDAEEEEESAATATGDEPSGQRTEQPRTGAAATAKPVSCGRVLLLAARYDDTSTTDISSILASLPAGATPRRYYTLLGYLHARFPEVSGLLCVGKPGVLIAEGPLHIVEALLHEVRKLGGAWSSKERDFEISRPLLDVDAWREFDGFQRIRIENLQALLGSLGKKRWVELVFPARKKVSRYRTR